jgi:hypothetical protein
MRNHQQFIETALDAQIAQPPEEVFLLAHRILRDPLIKARVDKLNAAWSESNPFRDLSMSQDPEEPEVVFEWPDFAQQVADSLTRSEKLELRKRIKARR